MGELQLIGLIIELFILVAIFDYSVCQLMTFYEILYFPDYS